MRYVLILIIIFSLYSFIMPNVFALGVSEFLDMGINSPEQSTFPNKVVTYQIKITNNQDINDSFVIRVRGEKLYWIIQPVLLTNLENHSTKILNISIYPSEEIVDRFTYNIFVKSTTFPQINKSAEIVLNTLPPLIVESLSGSFENNQVNIELPVTTGREMNIDIAYLIENAEGQKILEESFTETVDGIETISKSFALPERIPAGDYIIKVTVDNESEDSFVFSVRPVHNVVKTIKRTSDPLAEEIVISITNRGNVIERNYEIHETTPSGVLTGFITSPVKCQVEEQDRTCTYVIEDLGIDETHEITYRLEFYPTYIQIGLVIIIMLSIVIYSFKSATKPKISKRHIKKDRNIHNIIIEIRNPFFHNLKNVILRDWVSPLGHVLKEEVEHLSPIIRKSEAGTELIWKLGDIKPKEVRIISYKIKTLVQGSLKMPKARMRFITPKGKKWKIKTNSLIVE